MAPPELEYFSQRYHPNGTWQVISRQIDDLVTPMPDLEPGSNEAKRAFRLTVPLIGKIAASLSVYGRMMFLYLVQCLAGFIFFYTLCRVYARKAGGVAGLLIAINFCLIYTGKSFFMDMLTFDAIAFLLLTLAVFTNNLLLIFVFLFAAFYVDERAALGGIFVYLYHYITKPPDVKRKLFTMKELAIACSFAAYALSRYYLAYNYHLSVPTGNEANTGFLQFATGARLNMIPIGIFGAFKSLWLLVPITIYLSRRQWGVILVYLLALGGLLIISLSVYDLTRTVAYAFPLIFIGLEKIRSHIEDDKTLRTALFVTMLINFIIPSYFTMTTIHWIKPIFIYLLAQ